MTQEANGEAAARALVAVGEARSALYHGVPQDGLQTHTHSIGVIVPPPDIRAIADKAAHFVARNGPEFERRILANEASNVKFNFLKPGDPYNAYYQHKVAEIKAADAGEAQGIPPAQAAPPAAQPAPVQKPTTVLPPTKPLEPPREDFYTAYVPEGLSLLDLDVIKLTAQFVARNGKSFLTGLTSREHSNPQFNFLKPTHSLFTFFTRLCDAYSRVLMPPKGVLADLQRDVDDPSAPLQRALNRLEFERVQDKEAQEAADAEEAERMAMLSIDWQDFVVVATIDFDEVGNASLPGPMTLKQIRQMARAAAFVEENGAKSDEEKKEAAGRVEMDAEEQALVAQAQRAPAPPLPPTAADSGDVDMELSDEEEAAPIRVVKDYRRQDARTAAMAATGGYDPTRYVVSPITGELVPIEQMEEHMRVSLIDPKWKQQKDIMLAKIKETTKASDDEIGRNLALLAQTRPDVFGADAATVSSAVHKQIEAERAGDKTQPPHVLPPPPVPPAVWASTTAPPPRPIHAAPPAPDQAPIPPPPTTAPPPPPIHAAQPAPAQAPIPPPPTTAPPPPPSVPQRVPLTAPETDGGVEEEEQDAKRRRIDGSLVLVPEADFVADNPGQRIIRVQCPEVAGNAALNGQLLEIEVPSLLESVQSLKDRISGAVGLAVNKLRLGREGVGILVDALSLGHYNVDADVVLQLSIKERGGRRK